MVSLPSNVGVRGTAYRQERTLNVPSHISKMVPSTVHSGPQGGRSQTWGNGGFTYHRPRGTV